MSTVIDNLRRCKVPFLTEQDNDFRPSLESFTSIDDDRIPTLITLPESPEQVSIVVATCVNVGHQFTVRGRGHDSYGRYSKHGSVCIDLRNLKAITVSMDEQTATIGAGNRMSEVLQTLGEHGLVAASGGCADVGFVGWSLAGGFGPYSGSYGIGADQIVGAELVNDKGQVVNADDALLKGLRGGAGLFGIVVSLTVKVYQCREIQAGVVLFDNSDFVASATAVLSGYEAIASCKGCKPTELCVAPLVLPIPKIGNCFAVGIVWNGPASDRSREWISKITSLAPVLPGTPGLPDAIKTTTPVAFIREFAKNISPRNFGRIKSATLSHFSDQSIALLAKHGHNVPLGCQGGMAMHIVAPESPSCLDSAPEAITPYHRPLIMVELQGLGADEEKAKLAVSWAVEARNELLKADAALDADYIPLTASDEFDAKKVFGEKYPELMELKKQFDPDNIFCNSHPRLEV